MTRLLRYRWLCLALLAGCTPQWGEPVAPDAGSAAPQFDVVKIDERVVATLEGRPSPALHDRLGAYEPPPEPTIAVGDVVSVTIREMPPGGLFAPAPPQPAAANRGGHPETPLPDQPVGADGAISIPYGGRIPAAGRTVAGLQQAIQEGLAGKAVMPQALVAVRPGAANAATVGGESIAGKRVALTPGGDRLLQVLAQAGGTRAPAHDMVVRVSRGGATAEVSLARLIAEPAENIHVRPGDVITLVRRPRTFSVFGATGKNAAFTFDRDRVSLAEALAQAGGLVDERADPRAVFLFRYEPDGLVATLGQPSIASTVADMTPVAYRLDLGDAHAYLLAGRFAVRDGDVIFAADAASRPLYRFVAALSQVTGPVVGGLVACRYAKC